MKSLIFLFNFLVHYFLTNADDTCLFAAKCTCDQVKAGVVNVNCNDVSTEFPQFNSTSSTIASLTISGNFTNIPTRAFYNLETSIVDLVLTRTRNPFLDLTVNSDAFTTPGETTFNTIKFTGFKGLKTVPNGLTSARNLQSLKFTSCGIESLTNESFAGLNYLYALEITNNGLREIDPNTFTMLQDSLSVLTLHNNELTDIPDGLTELNTLQILDLENNKITKVSGQPFPSILFELVLSNNPLASFNDDSFNNVRNISNLQLNNCNFTEIPSNIFKDSILRLSSLQLKNNQITQVNSDDFASEFQLSEFPALDDNPIGTIEDGAFSGLINVEIVEIWNLYELLSIDLKVFSSMPKLSHIRLKEFSKLEYITLTADLPTTLNSITINYSEHISGLDSSIGNWLAKSARNLLDISYNEFYCYDGLQWINEYLFCSFHPQIIVTECECQDIRLPLKSYLLSLDRSCD